MNFSLYILGTPDGRYSQYPDDYTASTLSELQDGMAGARLVIWREMDLVHYAYTERIGNNCIIGFCLIYNKVWIQKPRQLIRLFRFIIEKRLVESGEIIKYSEDGELQFRVKAMNECIKEYDRLKGFLNSEFENNASKYDIEPITTVYNGVRSTGELDSTASDGQIVSMTNQHNKVIVNDDNGIEHGYIPQVIASLREQNQKANEEIARLKEDNVNLERKKKQYSFVILLSLIIWGCLVGLFFLYDNLNSTKGQLVDAKNTIVNKNNVINRLNTSRDSFKLCLINEKQEKSDLENKLSAIYTSVPFVITDCIINEEEITVEYYAIEQKDVTISLKAINESEQEIVSNSHSVTIYEGKNNLKLRFYYRLNSANYYYVNVIYDGHVIGGKRW